MSGTPANSRERGVLPPWNGEALLASFGAHRDRLWTQAYASLDRPSITGAAKWTGTLPSGLRGMLFRNGPAKHERGGARYAHRWDGDGMVQRFTLADTGVKHYGRYVETSKYLAVPWRSEDGRDAFDLGLVSERRFAVRLAHHTTPPGLRKHITGPALLDLLESNEHEALTAHARQAHVIEHGQAELTGQVALEQRAHDVAAAMVVATHEYTKVTSHNGRRLQLRDGEPFAAVSHPRDIDEQTV